MKFFQTIDFPLGQILIIADNSVILKIQFSTENFNYMHKPNYLTQLCAKQLQEYFKRKRKSFQCPYKLHGTEFQKKVWLATRKIPYGQTVSYKYLAEKIGHPNAVRAVANALGANQLPIIIPCHRVIRSNGQIGGFSAGIEIKKFLLSLENMTF